MRWMVDYSCCLSELVELLHPSIVLALEAHRLAEVGESLVRRGEGYIGHGPAEAVLSQVVLDEPLRLRIGRLPLVQVIDLVERVIKSDRLLLRLGKASCLVVGVREGARRFERRVDERISVFGHGRQSLCQG